MLLLIQNKDSYSISIFLPVSSFAISIIIHASLHTHLRFSKVYT